MAVPLALIVAQQGMQHAEASLAASCSATDHTVHVFGERIGLSGAGGDLYVWDLAASDGAAQLCSAVAEDAYSVHIELDGPDAYLRVDMSRKVFEPGRSLEESELSQVDIYLESSVPPVVSIIGTSGDDRIEVVAAGIKLNANEDVNFFIANIEEASINVDGQDGADILSAAAAPMGVRLRGDAGDDVLIGSAYRDFLGGGPGDDRLIGGSGRDFLLGEDGEDEAEGGAGLDNCPGVESSISCELPMSIDGNVAVTCDQLLQIGSCSGTGEATSVRTALSAKVAAPSGLPGRAAVDGKAWLTARTWIDEPVPRIGAAMHTILSGYMYGDARPATGSGYLDLEIEHTGCAGCGTGRTRVRVLEFGQSMELDREGVETQVMLTPTQDVIQPGLLTVRVILRANLELAPVGLGSLEADLYAVYPELSLVS